MRRRRESNDRIADRQHALRLVSAFARESHHDFIGEVFDVLTYDPHGTLAFGDVRLRFAPTSHYVPTFAIRFDVGSASVTYSADSAPDDAIATLAHRTSLFVCEATLAPEGAAEKPRGHLTAGEAARLATKAEARMLALTHYPASSDPASILGLARAAYAGEIVIVDDGTILFPGR